MLKGALKMFSLAMIVIRVESLESSFCPLCKVRFFLQTMYSQVTPMHVNVILLHRLKKFHNAKNADQV